MASEDLSNLLREVLGDLQKPLSSLSAVSEVMQRGEDALTENINVIRNEMNELCERSGFGEDLKNNEIYHDKLEQLTAEKKKELDVKTATLQKISEVRAETAKLKRDLQHEQQQSTTRLGAQHKQLEREQAGYAAYLRLCSHVRLDSRHPGPEVRGAVSRAPTTDVTFSLQPAQLSAVQLTNRLWAIAAEHAAEHASEHGDEHADRHDNEHADRHDNEHADKHADGYATKRGAAAVDTSTDSVAHSAVGPPTAGAGADEAADTDALPAGQR